MSKDKSEANKSIFHKTIKTRWILLPLGLLFFWLSIEPNLYFQRQKKGVKAITIINLYHALELMHQSQQSQNPINFATASNQSIVLELQTPEKVQNFLQTFCLEKFILPTGTSCLCAGKYKIIFHYLNKNDFSFNVADTYLKLPGYHDKPLTPKSVEFFRALLPKDLDNH